METTETFTIGDIVKLKEGVKVGQKERGITMREGMLFYETKKIENILWSQYTYIDRYVYPFEFLEHAIKSKKL